MNKLLNITQMCQLFSEGLLGSYAKSIISNELQNNIRVINVITALALVDNQLGETVMNMIEIFSKRKNIRISVSNQIIKKLNNLTLELSSNIKPKIN